MKTKQAILSIAFILSLSLSFTSCESDSDYEPDVTIPEETEDSYVLSASTQPSGTLTADNGGNGYARTYLIRNASDFRLFVEKVNNGDFEASGEYAGENTRFILDHDLQIADDYAWLPIGSDTHPFLSTFDGNGHTISGTLSLKHNQGQGKATGQGSDRFGFFGNFAGSLQNLTLDLYVTTSPDQQFNSLKIGMLGYLSGGNLTNVHTVGKIEYFTASESQNLQIGGFSSYMRFCEVNNCSSNVNIDINGGPNQSGNLLRTENLYVGGLTAIIFGSDITDFANNGDINITNCEVNGLLYAGGLASANEYMRKPLLLIFDNKGDINVSNISTRNHDSLVQVAVGGLIGYGAINSQSGKVDNGGNITVHIGSRELFTYVGGLFGYCTDECIGLSNSGDVSNHSEIGYTGGCIGYMTSFDLSHMYNQGNVESTCEIPADVNDYPYRYGATGGIVGRIFSGKIHESTNSGKITSAASYMLYDEQCSYAGAMCGIGDHPRSCNTNYSSVNGEHTTAVNHEGFTWYATIDYQNGLLGNGHPYWSIFWRDLMTEGEEQYTCIH